jgi:hypothetical protein
MIEKLVWPILQDVLTSLAGAWYAEETGQTLVFTFYRKPLSDAQLITIDKDNKPTENLYSVGAFLGDDLQSIFYIETGRNWDTKRWYKIKEITPASMIIVEIEKAAGRKEIGNEILYTRKTTADPLGKKRN